MARRVYFAFHFENDIWRVNQVRNSNVVAGPDLAGFFDHSEYEEAKKKGEEEIKRLIRAKLNNTTVTVVLIGTETANRPYVKYEIAQSIARKNGLLGVYIHHLKNQAGQTSPRGPEPTVPVGIVFPTYDWDADLRRFAREIEEAGKRADAMRESGSPPPSRGIGFGSLIALGGVAVLGAIALARNPQNRRFTHQTVYLDGHTYTTCTFANCVLVTNTGDFRMRSCRIDGCTVQFKPEAQFGPNGSRIIHLLNAVNEPWPDYNLQMNADGTVTIE
jgi:hypothetical protein